MRNKLLMLSMTWLLPVAVLAAEGLVPCEGIDDCDYSQLLVLIGKVIAFLLQIAMLVATGVIIYAGVKMALEPAQPGSHTEAKKILWSAVGGLILTLAAYLIVKLIVTGLTDGVDTERYNLLQTVFGGN